MRHVFLATAILIMSACATPQRTAAGKIGCPPGEVRIVESDAGFMGVSEPVMRVQCHDQEFICSGKPGTSILDEMNCAKAVRRKGASPSAAYLTREDLQNEKKQNFDEFLESLSEPEPNAGKATQ